MNREALEFTIYQFARIRDHLQQAVDGTGDFKAHIGLALAASLSAMEVIRAEIKTLRQETTRQEQTKAESAMEDRLNRQWRDSEPGGDVDSHIA